MDSFLPGTNSPLSFPPACNCGTRLCEPVTGDCICPPRTVLPECTQCEPQTFGCHPLVGCEVCNCSRPGIVNPDVNCDTFSGQCRYDKTRNIDIIIVSLGP